MDPARFRQIKELFFAALDAVGAQREELIERACGEDAELRREVETLLARAERAGGFLARPVVGRGDGEAGLEEAPCPAEVAGFRVRRVLGFGGMGVVYLAEQQSPRREVALKVLRWDGAGAEARRRFEREARLLARLRHPGIAQVYEAGIAEGRPYLAMELVEGLQLVEHAGRAGLDVAGRLRLFAAVCEAVEHAHARGIVHRDLKPGNVLVGADGGPKVLDFGVARCAEEADAASCTRSDALFGTLPYMSPEQAARGAACADARSDVYSLGVILYELLSGRLPLDLRDGRLPESLRAVAEDEPTPLGAVAPALRGDLETIAAKALEKEPARRYASARELRADVERFLAGRPVRARRPGLAYHVSKLARRNPGIAAGLAAAFLLLGAGTAAALGGTVRAVRAAAEAERDSDAVLGLADARRLAELRAAAGELWPAVPEMAPAMADWLTRARAVAGRAGAHRAILERLDGRLARAQDGAAERRLAWLWEREAELVTALEEFAAPGGDLAAMERRHVLARTLRERTVEERRVEWDIALRSIADPTDCPAYGGLRIEPQVGLVPLGCDRLSGLWEFALYGVSGEVPRRSAESGELLFHESSAVVLVLLPGGEVELGAHPRDPVGEEEPGVAARRWRAALDPFFMSKFELTQAQWARAGGGEPSNWPAGSSAAGVVTTALHPVEHVTWRECGRILGRPGLDLPTEAQWEYAARAGTAGPWYSGWAPESLQGYENVAGRENLASPNTFTHAWQMVTEDPWLIHAPAGSLRPNPFGLFDMLGNVSEWCRDASVPPEVLAPRARPGDGLLEGGDPLLRSLRGGRYSLPPADAAAWGRKSSAPGARQADWGVRPARALAGRWSRPAARGTAKADVDRADPDEGQR